MRRICQPATIRILAAAGAALTLVLLTVGSLLVFTTPAQAGDQTGSAPARRPAALPSLQGALRIVKSATTEAAPADGSIVYNGDWITYTLWVYNDTGDAIRDITVNDDFTDNVLQEVGCSPNPAINCVVMSSTQSVNIPRRGVYTFSKPIQVTWAFTEPITFPLKLEFWGRVTCQAADSDFGNNPAVLNYHRGNGSTGFAVSNLAPSMVEVAPPAQDGHFDLSSAPAVCSNSGPAGGASDMDWGDFDNDGDLDLVLAASGLGVFVYRNDGGGLQLFWQDSSQLIGAEGVRWADFNADGYLELVASGQYDDLTGSQLPDGSLYPSTGYNYLYKLKDDQSSFEQYDDFTTNDGTWRAAAADFTGDRYLDLAMIGYWGGCTVHLYKNDGSQGIGYFNRSDPGSTNDSYCLFGPPFSYTAHSAAWSDYDSDGDPDLAVGHLAASGNGVIRVYVNESGELTETRYVPVDAGGTGCFRYAYDLAWGDYDSDGYLDLAAAFSELPRSSASPGNCGGFKVYRQEMDGSFTPVYTMAATYPVQAIDWADFNNDGYLELAVAGYNALPRLYQYVGVMAGNFAALTTSLRTSARGDALSIRAVDYDSDGDLDLAFTNYMGESWLFTAAAPFLQPRAGALAGPPHAYSVAWGEVTGGYPDLLYGTAHSYKLYANLNNGTFTPTQDFRFSPPATAAAFGDVDGDGALDAALGQNGQSLLYLNRGGSPDWFSTYPNWVADLADDTHSLLFADINQDNAGRPDLVVGNTGSNRLYINQGSMLATAPAWTSAESDDVRSVAWGYYDGDTLPDLAAANSSGPNRIYRNNGLDGFTLAQSLPAANSRGVAWGDYDGDGDMDLALGNYDQPVQVYHNTGGQLTLAWTAPVTRNTTSVAWGDWNNDGRLDLAVGNYGQKAQVYTNLGSTGSRLNLIWLWEAAVVYNTTGLAWGDYDGDGDMDLAFSQDGNPSNGTYENTYVRAAHLSAVAFMSQLPLVRNPTYLAVSRPGKPGQIFQRSALTSPASLTIPITFRLYDPDGSRQVLTDQPGYDVKVTSYQFSLNGGGRWYTAQVTPALGITLPLATHRRGEVYTVTWRAGEDLAAKSPNRAVSDDVRFRIAVVIQNTPPLTYATAGRLQRTVGAAASPAFRIRNISCMWAEDPYILMQPMPPTSAGTVIHFVGGLSGPYGGTITYTWDFGGVISPGQVMIHSYDTIGDYVVTLTVTQPPCPNTHFDFVTTTLSVTPRVFSNPVYLPIIIGSGTGASSTGGIAKPAVGVVTLDLARQSPHQVTGLQGETQVGNTSLRWNPGRADDGIVGYRIYRSQAKALSFQRLAQVPAATTTYTDTTAMCGYAYFVTAFNAQGESLPSTSSYYNPSCQ